MLKVAEKNARLSLLEKSLTLIERFEQNGDLERTGKTKKLLKKIYSNEFIAAFSGHFSAGKSTMINALVGEEVLPSSPIPTSANLVKVYGSDREFSKVHYHNKKPLIFHAPYSFETVKEFCKNGDVLEIEIGKMNGKIPKGITIMDTPGVDSTDDAHRLSTESALHLADLVFYVMDYNHVQSELNFIYTKNLLMHGTRLYLIINQIDKHNDSELSFEDYKKSVQLAFEAWDVHPDRIFFTTLKQPDHPFNEFPDVKNVLREAMLHHKEWMEKTVRTAQSQLIAEHTNWLQEQKILEIEPFDNIISGYSEEHIGEAFQKEANLERKITELTEMGNKWAYALDQEREKLFKNAYLMPYETRAAAEKFLEAFQPDFKVGFFRSKAKTEAEKQRRLRTFSEQVKKQVETEVEWHMRELFAKKLSEAQVFNSGLESAAQSLKMEMDDRLFIDTIKKGARVTGEYVLNYCEEIATRLKRTAASQSEELKQAIKEEIEKKAEKEINSLHKELKQVKEITSALAKAAEIEKEFEQKAAVVTKPTGNEEERLTNMISEWKTLERNVTVYDETRSMPDKRKKQTRQNECKQEREAIPAFSFDESITKIEKAATLLSKEKSFQRIAEQLRKKVDRLKESNFTIALFGAFSAGKSSFANALLGEKVLPVSPNPTTAAISRICPPNHGHEHGTAVVRLKSSGDMLADVSQSLQLFGHTAGSLDEAHSMIPSVLAKQDSHAEAKEKVHLSFLSAFQAGYETFKDQLGNHLLADLQEFHHFVAVESQSCFVESIDLYYDCPFTRKGVTLVDTPGADSINARHTGVAFDYIKNSDAILFVTYYNHAFSKADREFLIQLGRVKDAFELDKMFFIVNAIDLASSKDEVDDVLHYVKNQLTEYGIRFPRIFGLSSKQAQLPDMRGQSGIDDFRHVFQQFLESDLTQMAVQSAVAEFQRATTMLDQMIAAASEDEHIKEERKRKLLESRDQLNRWLGGVQLGSIPDRLHQEAKELIHYVKQRVFFRLPDFFKEAFNPASLQNHHRDSLKKALDEYVQAAGFDFAQELRATSLRLEQFMKKLLQERFEHMLAEAKNIQKELAVSPIEFGKAESIDFVPAFQTVEKRRFEGAFKYFKNPKSFFEQNEKKRMEEYLESLLSPLADEYLQEGLEKLSLHYRRLLEREFNLLREHLQRDMEEQFAAWVAAFEEAGSLSEWIRLRNELASL
ncbi:dynamin family protein [Siminovitchia sp. 179-K 8D1 HS]|uniref:dynamin family protein n=1 Tax=Siminovitchia sp. 179-K 8D1 HS TaxID=3142385 RepID=UPI0039A39A72